MEKTVKIILWLLAVGFWVFAVATHSFGQPVVPTQTISIRLTWQDNSPNPTNPTAESGFIVEQCVGAGCTNFYTIGTPLPANTVSYIDVIHNDPGGRIIRYRVKAFLTVTSPTPGMLSSAYSNIAEVTTPAIVPAPTPPATPGPLEATPISPSAINLHWSDPDENETAFQIERDGRIVMEVAANSETITDHNLRRNRWYSYRVRGVSTVGNSSWSNRDRVRTLR